MDCNLSWAIVCASRCSVSHISCASICSDIGRDICRTSDLGSSLSIIVIVNEQLAELFDASVTLKIFVVVPVRKLVPLARPAVWIVACPEQLSVPAGVV